MTKGRWSSLAFLKYIRDPVAAHHRAIQRTHHNIWRTKSYSLRGRLLIAKSTATAMAIRRKYQHKKPTPVKSILAHIKLHKEMLLGATMDSQSTSHTLIHPTSPTHASLDKGRACTSTITPKHVHKRSTTSKKKHQPIQLVAQPVDIAHKMVKPVEPLMFDLIPDDSKMDNAFLLRHVNTDPPHTAPKKTTCCQKIYATTH